MSWTREAPTAEGWFFYSGHYRVQCRYNATPVYLSQRSDGEWMVKGKPLAHYRGWWWPEVIQQPPEPPCSEEG